jgi:cobalamin biosynthesis protein CobW
LVQAFAWPDIRQRVMLDGVVTVVDGAALADGMVAADLNALEAQRQADPELDHETPVDELFRDQVAAANILIVSKGDLIDGAAGERVTGRLNALTDGTTPVMITRGDTALLKAIFGLGLEDEAFARSEHFDHHHHHHDDDHDDDHGHDDHGHDDHHDDHGHDAFHSVVLRLPMLDDHEAFIRNLTATVAEHGLLRAKGFLAIRGKALPLTVQAVGARVDSYFGGTLKDDEGRLVLIGLKQTDMAAIASSLGGEMIAGGMIAGAA